MINAAAIREIIELYKKHGWTLRRVLLSEPLRESLSTAAADVFGDVDMTTSDLDAAWFSRSSRSGQTAWEIRHLSETPFALVEVFGDDIDAQDAAETFRDAEARMIAMAAKKPRAN